MAPDTIHVACEGEIWIVELHGEHDLSTSPLLIEALRRADGPDALVIVDLTAARFIDSSVLAAIVHAGEHAAGAGGRLAVVAPATGHPRRLLDLVGLDRPSLPVVGTRAEATAVLTTA